MISLIFQALAAGGLGGELPSGEEGKVEPEQQEDKLFHYPCPNPAPSSVGRLEGSPLPYKMWGQGSR